MAGAQAMKPSMVRRWIICCLDGSGSTQHVRLLWQCVYHCSAGNAYHTHLHSCSCSSLDLVHPRTLVAAPFPGGVVLDYGKGHGLVGRVVRGFAGGYLPAFMLVYDEGLAGCKARVVVGLVG